MTLGAHCIAFLNGSHSQTVSLENCGHSVATLLNNSHHFILVLIVGYWDVKILDGIIF